MFGKDTPNFVGNRIGAHAHDGARSIQMLADGLAARGRRQHHRHADGASEERELPYRRPRRSRHLRARRRQPLHVADELTKTATSSRCRIHPHDGREEALGDKTKGGFFKRTPDKQNLTFDPEDARVPAEGW